MNKRIAYVIGSGKHDYGYGNWMGIHSFTDDIKSATMCIGLGGSDVSNKYYNQPNSGLLHCDEWTDKLEYEDYQEAIKLGLPICGTCKSAQWSSAVGGGAVFQDVSHSYIHAAKTIDGNTLILNSLHHNMADLSALKEDSDFVLYAWAENLSPIHINGWRQNIKCVREPEIFWMKKLNWLSFQNHNEMLFRQRDIKEINKTITWSQNLLTKFLDGKL